MNNAEFNTDIELTTSLDGDDVGSRPSGASEAVGSYVAEARRLFGALSSESHAVEVTTGSGFDPATLGTPPGTVSNADFVAAIFMTAGDGAIPVVCSKAGDPTNDSGWPPQAVRNVDSQCPPDHNNYFNCSTFRRDFDGTIRAKKANFAFYAATVLDDVGSKVAFDRLEGIQPSWIIETSPGNFQVGFIHDTPQQDLGLIDRLHRALRARGLSDPDALNGATRWARLPVAINGKHKYRDSANEAFRCKLVTWNPERRFSFDQTGTMLSIQAEFEASGRQAPQQLVREIVDEQSVEVLEKLLDAIDPNCGYRDWTNACMAVHNETAGSDAGLDLVDAWSSRGKGYPGRQTMEAKWRSFRSGSANPVTIGTLIQLARRDNPNSKYIDALAKGFVPCEMEVVPVGRPQMLIIPSAPSVVAEPVVTVFPNTVTATPASVQTRRHLLERYSLRGQSAELKKRSLGEKPILGDIGLQGQLMVIYAAPNTGKTLITLHLLCEGIQKGVINPDRLFYLNMDDNSKGLAEKSRIADDLGFHLIVGGYQGFKARDLEPLVAKMVEDDVVDGAVIVLDTMKKFVNVMKKDDCSRFAGGLRNFVVRGGTLIALAHTNKNPGADGEKIYSGTTDIIDDFDNAYMLTQVAVADNVKTVEFKNIKRRANNPDRAGYSYSVERLPSYEDVLLTVKEVDLMDLDPIKQAAVLVADEKLIRLIEGRIKSGTVKRMELIKAVSEVSGASRVSVGAIVEKYTGEDASLHKWRYKKGPRGAHLFELLDRPATELLKP